MKLEMHPHETEGAAFQDINACEDAGSREHNRPLALNYVTLRPKSF